MRRWAAAVAVVVATSVFSGCGPADTREPATVDPSEAFPPRVIHAVDQTGTWDRLNIKVKTASAYGEYESDDIELSIDVEYTNVGSADVSPPKDVSFEFAGKSYPAAATGTAIAGGATGESWITGTLTDVVKAEPTSREEMDDILSRTRLLIGAPGTAQAEFLLTQH